MTLLWVCNRTSATRKTAFANVKLHIAAINTHGAHGSPLNRIDTTTLRAERDLVIHSWRARRTSCRSRELAAHRRRAFTDLRNKPLKWPIRP